MRFIAVGTGKDQAAAAIGQRCREPQQRRAEVRLAIALCAGRKITALRARTRNGHRASCCQVIFQQCCVKPSRNQIVSSNVEISIYVNFLSQAVCNFR